MKQKRTQRVQRKRINRITQKKGIVKKNRITQKGGVPWGRRRSTYVEEFDTGPKLKFYNGVFHMSLLSGKDLSSLKLKNLKFFSTHNSFIAPCQFGCEVKTDYVDQYLKHIADFPICIEIDIVLNPDRKFTEISFEDIWVSHVTTNSEYLEKIFLHIRTKINSIAASNKVLYPLILSIDTSQLKSNIRDDVLVKVRQMFESKFEDLVIQPGKDILDLSLRELKGKVLIRYRGEGADIGNEKNITRAFSNPGNRWYRWGNPIKKLEKESGKKKDSFFRIYPKDKLFNEASEVISHLKLIREGSPEPSPETSRRGTTVDLNALANNSTTNGPVEAFALTAALEDAKLEAGEVGEARVAQGENISERANSSFLDPIEIQRLLAEEPPPSPEKSVARKDSGEEEPTEHTVGGIKPMGPLVAEEKTTEHTVGGIQLQKPESTDNPSYKKLSTQIIDLFLYKRNHINCVAFNYHDLDEDKREEVKNAFIQAYQRDERPSVVKAWEEESSVLKLPAPSLDVDNNNSPSVGGPENSTFKGQSLPGTALVPESSFVGGGKKRTKRLKKKQQNKRKIKSNKKSYLKRKQ